MYEKTLTIGTAKVNNAYEWQKVSYTKNQVTTTTPTTKPKQKQHKPNNNSKTVSNSAKNATKTAVATKTAETTTTLTASSKPATQTVFKKFAGNAARRQTLAHQIKRAHRHLLTSGGNDKKPQKQPGNCLIKQPSGIKIISKKLLIF